MDYSGLFCGVRAVTVDDATAGVVYGRVELPGLVDSPGGVGAGVEDFGLHPALLDSALQLIAVLADNTSDDHSALPALPFAFTGVHLYASAATSLLVRVDRIGEQSFSVSGFDPAGHPVISIDSITLRSANIDLVAPAGPAGLSGPGGGLLSVDWLALPEDLVTISGDIEPGWVITADTDTDISTALEIGQPTYPGDPLDYLQHTHRSGDPLASTALWILGSAAGDTDSAVDGAVGRVHRVLSRVRAVVAGWLVDPRSAGSRLVLVCERAVAVGAFDRAADVVHGGVWGLVGSAVSEHPGRVAVIDTDRSPASRNSARWGDRCFGSAAHHRFAGGGAWGGGLCPAPCSG